MMQGPGFASSPLTEICLNTLYKSSQKTQFL